MIIMTRLLALIAPGFEEIEAVTVIDLLRRAEIEIITGSITLDRNVKGAHNINLVTDSILNTLDVSKFDGVFLPGGQPGTNNLLQQEKVLDIVRTFAEKNKWVIAICAAPLVLKKAGVLKKRQITSHPTETAAFDPKYYREKKVVREGNIITSRGVGTAIDLGLYLIEEFCGKANRQKQAERILWE